MIFAKDNAADDGFNRWTINGVAYPMSNEMVPASFHLKEGKRYRIHMRNASDDIHPVHLHRHSFELTQNGGKDNIRNFERCSDAGWLSGSRNRFRREQPWADTISLSPAITHGLRFHDPFRLRVICKDEL